GAVGEGAPQRVERRHEVPDPGGVGVHVAVDVVTGNHQVVAGPGAGDVEETQLLVGVHLQFEVGPGVVVGGLDTFAELDFGPAVVVPHHTDTVAGSGRFRGQAGE